MGLPDNANLVASLKALLVNQRIRRMVNGLREKSKNMQSGREGERQQRKKKNFRFYIKITQKFSHMENVCGTHTHKKNSETLKHLPRKIFRIFYILCGGSAIASTKIAWRFTFYLVVMHLIDGVVSVC